MHPLALGYALIGLFLGLERLLRRGEAARSLRQQPSDQGTTRLLGAAYGCALNAGLAAPVLSRLGVGRLPEPRPATIGPGMMVAGLLLRAWAARSLGHFCTRTLRVDPTQTVVRSGPYRWVRHPRYAASLRVWLGFALASGNTVVAATISVALVLAYGRRIQVEEAMLARELGEPYRAYLRETWRLVPNVY